MIAKIEIMGSIHGLVKQKIMKLVYAASPISTQYLGVRAKTGWFVIRTVCHNGAT
jgi:hypothetical protein